MLTLVIQMNQAQRYLCNTVEAKNSSIDFIDRKCYSSGMWLAAVHTFNQPIINICIVCLCFGFFCYASTFFGKFNSTSHYVVELHTSRLMLCTHNWRPLLLPYKTITNNSWITDLTPSVCRTAVVNYIYILELCSQ